MPHQSTPQRCLSLMNFACVGTDCCFGLVDVGWLSLARDISIATHVNALSHTTTTAQRQFDVLQIGGLNCHLAFWLACSSSSRPGASSWKRISTPSALSCIVAAATSGQSVVPSLLCLLKHPSFGKVRVMLRHEHAMEIVSDFYTAASEKTWILWAGDWSDRGLKQEQLELKFVTFEIVD